MSFLRRGRSPGVSRHSTHCDALPREQRYTGPRAPVPGRVPATEKVAPASASFPDRDLSQSDYFDTLEPYSHRSMPPAKPLAEQHIFARGAKVECRQAEPRQYYSESISYAPGVVEQVDRGTVSGRPFLEYTIRLEIGGTVRVPWQFVRPSSHRNEVATVPLPAPDFNYHGTEALDDWREYAAGRRRGGGGRGVGKGFNPGRQVPNPPPTVLRTAKEFRASETSVAQRQRAKELQALRRRQAALRAAAIGYASNAFSVELDDGSVV